MKPMHLSSEHRRILLRHSPAPALSSNDLWAMPRGVAVVSAVLFFILVPFFGYYVPGCSAESDYEDELLSHELWNSFRSGECKLSTQSKCPMFHAVVQLATKIEKRNNQDSAYGAFADALDDLDQRFDHRAFVPDPERDLAIDVILKKADMPGAFESPPAAPSDIASTPWFSMILLFFGSSGLAVFAVWAHHAWIVVPQHIERHTRDLEGLDQDLLNFHFDLLAEELRLRTRKRQSKKADGEIVELRRMMAEIQEAQSARNRGHSAEQVEAMRAELRARLDFLQQNAAS